MNDDRTSSHPKIGHLGGVVNAGESPPVLSAGTRGGFLTTGLLDNTSATEGV